MLLFTFIFPVIQAPSIGSAEIWLVITFLIAAYSKVNGATSDFPEGDVDEVVKEYIKNNCNTWDYLNIIP